MKLVNCGLVLSPLTLGLFVATQEKVVFGEVEVNGKLGDPLQQIVSAFALVI